MIKMLSRVPYGYSIIYLHIQTDAVALTSSSGSVHQMECRHPALGIRMKFHLDRIYLMVVFTVHFMAWYSVDFDFPPFTTYQRKHSVPNFETLNTFLFE